MPDYEVWQAMHNDCPSPGCGRCVVVEDIEVPFDVIEAAKYLGEPVDVFLHRAIVEGMRAEGW